MYLVSMKHRVIAQKHSLLDAVAWGHMKMLAAAPFVRQQKGLELEVSAAELMEHWKKRLVYLDLRSFVEKLPDDNVMYRFLLLNLLLLLVVFSVIGDFMDDSGGYFVDRGAGRVGQEINETGDACPHIKTNVLMLYTNLEELFCFT